MIDPAAQLDPSVIVGPYAVIESGVELGSGVAIGAHAVLRAGTIVGPDCRIESHAILGGGPQDLHFDPQTPSGVRLGRGVVVGEGATVHRSTRAGQSTEVGDGAFLMAYAHVGHDCRVGARVILANNVMLAGFVEVGAYAFLGGGAAIHQHARVGESAMISGLSRVSRDVPPFCMMAERDELVGLNVVGLKRRGFERAAIRGLKEAYRRVCGRPGNLRARAAEAVTQPELDPLARQFLEFFAGGRRGFAQPSRVRASAAEAPDEA